MIPALSWLCWIETILLTIGLSISSNDLKIRFTPASRSSRNVCSYFEKKIDRLTGLVTDGILQLDFYLGPQFEAVLNLMSKYRDTPMSLADACLVRMSEIFPRSRVFTLDSDFLHYRRNGRSVIPLIYPGDQR